MVRIGTHKIQTGAEIVEIPIYEIADVSYPAIRVSTDSGIGCYDLVEPTTFTPLRIQTSNGIMGINTGILNSGIVTELLNFDNYDTIGVSTVLVGNTAQYLQVDTDTNGNGLSILLRGYSPRVGDRLVASIDVDITQGVDDVVSVRLWNVTQDRYINDDWLNGTVTSGTETLTGNYTLTSSDFVDGDEIQIRVVQSFRNSTHDDYSFKLLKTSSLTTLVPEEDGGGQPPPGPPEAPAGNGDIDIASYTLIGAGTLFVAETSGYLQVNTFGNGNGVGFTINKSLVVGNSISVNADLDITQGVDDVLSLRLWNLTQNKYITTNLKTGTEISGPHTLANTYTLTSTNFANGDSVELRIVQAWKNSTHDDFIYKVMKTTTLTVT